MGLLLPTPVTEPGPPQGRADPVPRRHRTAPCDSQKGRLRFLPARTHGHTRVSNGGALHAAAA